MSPTTPVSSSLILHFERTGTGPINSNFGSGDQTNSTQTGGRNNRLFYVRDYHEHDHSTTPSEKFLILRYVLIFEGNDDTPPPSHNLPFLRDDEFVERLELVDLQQKLASPGKRVALSGIGGVGKSQLALEYCYRQRQEKPDVWVLWIHAGSAARYDDDMRSLAERVKIPGRENTKANIHQLVQGWLGDARNGNWLLVVDNVDDIEILADSSKDESSNKLDAVVSKARLEYLPVCEHGSILYTTRRRTVATKLVDDRDIIDILPNIQHAEEMLKLKLGQFSTANINKKLGTALEHMPLAIAQAIAYVRHSQPQCTPEEYLAMLEKGDDTKTQLLSEVAEEVRRDFREASDSIILSWHISFEHICTRRESAADLLSLMSFYNHQGTPRFLLEDTIVSEPDEYSTSTRFKTAVREFFSPRAKHKHTGKHREPKSYQALLSQTTLDGDIKVLKDYSFISSKSHRDSFEMHRLVQLAAQVWLKKKQSFDVWQSESIRRLTANFPISESDLWAERKKCHSLYLHARLALDWRPSDHDAQLELAEFMYRASCFADAFDMDKQAEAMCRRALEIRSSFLAVDDVRVLAVSNTLTSILRQTGRFDLARNQCQQVLKYIEKRIGRTHPDVLTSHSLLADIYLDQGDYNAGKKLHKQVLRSRSKALGLDDPNTLRSMKSVGVSLMMLQEFDEAEEVLQETLVLQNKVLQPGDPDILRSMHCLALLFHYSGRREQSSAMHKELFAIYREQFGETHPRTIAISHNYGIHMHASKEFEDAEKLMLRAWTDSTKVLGNEHPDTLISMDALAHIYIDMGRLDEGIGLMERCVEARSRVLPNSHPQLEHSKRWLHHYHVLRERENIVTKAQAHADTVST